MNLEGRIDGLLHDHYHRPIYTEESQKTLKGIDLECPQKSYIIDTSVLMSPLLVLKFVSDRLKNNPQFDAKPLINSAYGQLKALDHLADSGRLIVPRIVLSEYRFQKDRRGVFSNQYVFTDDLKEDSELLYLVEQHFGCKYSLLSKLPELVFDDRNFSHFSEVYDSFRRDKANCVDYTYKFIKKDRKTGKSYYQTNKPSRHDLLLYVFSTFLKNRYKGEKEIELIASDKDFLVQGAVRNPGYLFQVFQPIPILFPKFNSSKGIPFNDVFVRHNIPHRFL